ncbi:NCS1 nucleoside transporter family protein-like protein [Aureobasidium pullulans]|uniref:NCS1 nucleoside transporter family protein-like protein n=1 Tax=Aureobasidium pullulans TaxID=5580 RepID=A0A4T0EKL3_AURPU|nr:NCS1 nucleoside transporter family protein-like protein [Aureobasidium pullulans]
MAPTILSILITIFGIAAQQGVLAMPGLSTMTMYDGASATKTTTMTTSTTTSSSSSSNDNTTTTPTSSATNSGSIPNVEYTTMSSSAIMSKYTSATSIIMDDMMSSMNSAMWHIGFTVQNRYTWGLRGSYIPLLQRILLNFIWCAIQCWNGGRLIAVCITAIWPSFAKMHNTLPSSMPTTTYQFVGFVLFWVLSVPFLFVRPEKFRLPFLITSIYCGLGMLSMMIWSLSVAKGVGPLWTTGQTIPENSSWNLHWLEMKGINQIIGGIAAGITNGSDFSRYARSPKNYVLGTVLSAWVTGVLVSLVGLVVTAACQKIYGEVYWNPPDLLMRMMDSGEGSSKARAGVFFLAAGFALTGMFENVCGNAVAGGIDLAGLFPRYLDIRRGAILTFVAVWVCQPWQLVNKAATFVSVLSSFSVFLSPIMGVMVVDFYLLRKGRIQLSHLYRTKDTSYWFTKGVNWRAIPAWMCGWAPTIGGLVVTVGGSSSPPRGLVKLYYMAFLVGFFVSGTVFYLLNWIFPYPGMGEYDEVDVYETFTPREAASLGSLLSLLGLGSTVGIAHWPRFPQSFYEFGFGVAESLCC